MPIAIDLTDRVALVTGGSRGVGRGIVRVLLEAGATVVAAGRTEPPDGDEGALPSDVGFLSADVRDPEADAALVNGIVERHGRLDVVVNNAGGSPTVAAADAGPRFSQRVVELNLMAALHLGHAALPALRCAAEEHGQASCIVNVASLSGLRPSPGTAAYGAAKAGLVNLTRTLAMEWAPDVRVNCVSAGMVRTEQFDDYYGGPEGAAAAAATVPMGRPAEPADVGHAVAWLASPLAAYVSGANVEVHGGGERLDLHRFLPGD